MIQSLADSEAATRPLDHPRLWGLTARRLHEAFWHARGVQCIHRGEGGPLQRAAELYLLVEPDQLVLFNLSELSDRLAWRNASVTRVRLVDKHREPYSEHVVLDDDGLVQRIERRYSATLYGSYRLVLTTSRRVALIWANAHTRREGWVQVRRAVPWSRVDHCHAEGWVLRNGDPKHEHHLVNELVARWSTPNQSILGIEEAEPGVWIREGEELDANMVRVGPLWIGGASDQADRLCFVGPDWVSDGPGTTEEPAEVCSIEEVEMAEHAVGPSTEGVAPVYAMLKRGLDIVGSLLALLFFSPVMLAVALLILIEDGSPIFFGHRRQGRGGRPFQCLKFRTMQRDAERIARELAASNVCDGPQVFIRDDPRVTRVGKWLRIAHLDELPQLWNVLIGEMSLVGPRPSPDDENQYCPSWREARLSVRPGITGLWQLNRTRRPGEDFQEWIKYDLEYVRRASLWLDLIILVKTARLLILGRGDGEEK